MTNRSKQLQIRLLGTTIAASAIFAASPAFAQDGQPLQQTEPLTEQTLQETQTDDTVVVTGTLIRNPNLVSSAPVNAIGEDEIDLQQANVAEELLRELPGAVPAIGSAVNNGNGGQAFVDLRGLGSNRNLTLLDGVRVAPGDLLGRVDLNNIPLALVQRVDVLTGGASTTYGADAISGVVNFITRQDFAGVDVNLSNQITERGDGHTFRADVTIGANFDDGRGNAVFSVGYQEADPVYQGDRPFSLFSIDSFSGANGGSGLAPSPARISGVNPTGRDSVTQNCGGAGQPACANVQGLFQIAPGGGAFNQTTAFTPFNFNPFNIFQTPFERFNMYGAARYEVSDAVEVYARGLFSKQTVSTIVAPSGAFGILVDIPLNNPFLTAATRNAFCNFDTNPGVGFTPRFSPAECAAAATATGPTDPNYRQVNVELRRRASEFGPRISDFTTQYFDYRVGIRGGITESIDYDLFGSYGESEQNQVQQGYYLNSRVRQALLAGPNGCFDASNGCVPLNVFGSASSITPEQNAFLTANSTVATVTSMSQVRGVISGDVGYTMPWAAEAIGFAVGGEFREYRASQESDLLSQSGDLGGAGGAAPNISGGFDVYEAFGELILPIIADRPFFNELTLEAGARYSQYSIDAPNDPTFDTFTWKVGGTWEPMDGLRFRGNYAHSVRAPNINELFAPVNTVLTNLNNDPCANIDDNGAAIPGRPAPTGALRDVCIAQGAPASSIGFIPQPAAGQANVTTGGNINLEPEVADSWTAGAVIQPDFLPGFSMSIDYYNIRINGAITTPTPDDAINACFNSGNLSPTNPDCLSIRRNPTDGGLSGDPAIVPGIAAALSNLGTIRTDGIDLTLNYSRDIGFAQLALSFVGNWTMSNEFQANPVSVVRDCVAVYSANCGSPAAPSVGSIQPEFSWSQRTTLTFGNVDVSLLWRHIGAVAYEFADTDPAFSGPVPGLGGRVLDFNHIDAHDYFDLTTRFNVNDNFTFTFGIQNLLDQDPPIVGSGVGSTTFGSGNTFPATYDALGRRFVAGARLRF